MSIQPAPAPKLPAPGSRDNPHPHWSDKHKAPVPVVPVGGLSKRWARAAHQVAPMFGSAFLSRD